MQARGMSPALANNGDVALLNNTGALPEATLDFGPPEIIAEILMELLSRTAIN
jgi:hypothetical protein